MSTWHRFLAFLAAVYTHKPEDDPVTDSIDTTVVQSGAAYAAAPVANAQTAAAQTSADQPVPSPAAPANEAATVQPKVLGVDVQSGGVLFPGELLTTGYISSAELDAKAKSIFLFLVGEGHKAEDLFIEARNDIFALAAKLV